MMKMMFISILLVLSLISLGSGLMLLRVKPKPQIYNCQRIHNCLANHDIITLLTDFEKTG